MDGNRGDLTKQKKSMCWKKRETVGVRRRYFVGSESGGRSHEPRNTGMQL